MSKKTSERIENGFKRIETRTNWKELIEIQIFQVDQKINPSTS